MHSVIRLKFAITPVTVLVYNGQATFIIFCTMLHLFDDL